MGSFPLTRGAPAFRSGASPEPPCHVVYFFPLAEMHGGRHGVKRPSVDRMRPGCQAPHGWRVGDTLCDQTPKWRSRKNVERLTWWLQQDSLKRLIPDEVSEIWAGTNGRSTPEKRKQGKARNPGAVFRGEAHSREGPLPDLGSPPWREITGLETTQRQNDISGQPAFRRRRWPSTAQRPPDLPRLHPSRITSNRSIDTGIHGSDCGAREDSQRPPHQPGWAVGPHPPRPGRSRCWGHGGPGRAWWRQDSGQETPF
ncbi:uncharacterized protein LOC118609401 [Rousettus aegyptiacus]|uniref:uncharacterized protein LOC118609401 n=1 Tax=Rousettus aegyptiacus TaxID=9407 RepID=UPI00168D3AEF|nr:uncharacterized protein LOC118609401 [Rousettus aegyptiacus]